VVEWTHFRASRNCNGRFLKNLFGLTRCHTLSNNHEKSWLHVARRFDQTRTASILQWSVTRYSWSFPAIVVKLITLTKVYWSSKTFRFPAVEDKINVQNNITSTITLFCCMKIEKTKCQYTKVASIYIKVKLYPIVLYYVQHIFPRGAKNFSLVTGLIKINKISFLGMLRRELCLWPFAKKLYHGWISTMTSSNERSWKLPPKMKSWLRPWPKWYEIIKRLGTPVIEGIKKST